MNLLSVILPIYILVFLGYWLRRTDRVQIEGMKTLKYLLLTIAVPSLLFHGLVSSDFENIDVSGSYLLYYSMLVLFFILSFLFSKYFLKLKNDEASVMSLASVFSNNIYVGLPIIIQFLGEEVLSLYFALLLFHSFVTLLPAYVIIELSKSSDNWLRSIGLIVIRVMLSPIIFSLLLALAFRSTGLAMPDFIGSSLKTLSAMAMPIALILLGAEFCGFKVKGNVFHALIIVLINNIIMPISVYIVGRYFMQMEKETLQLIIILVSVPMGLMPYLTAMQYGVYLRRTMSAFLISNAIAPVTMLTIFWMIGL